MKGFSEVTIQNRPFVVEYKGEHYVVRNANTGRVTRMAKADIIKKFHLHHDALDRHIAGGFKKPHCNANEDIILVKRSKNDVESISFFVTSAVVIACGVALILAVVLGYVDRQTLRPYVVGDFLRNLERAYLREVESEYYGFSESDAREYAEANGYEFLEDGTIY